MELDPDGDPDVAADPELDAGAEVLVVEAAVVDGVEVVTTGNDARMDETADSCS